MLLIQQADYKLPTSRDGPYLVYWKMQPCIRCTHPPRRCIKNAFFMLQKNSNFRQRRLSSSTFSLSILFSFEKKAIFLALININHYHFLESLLTNKCLIILCQKRCRWYLFYTYVRDVNRFHFFFHNDIFL